MTRKNKKYNGMTMEEIFVVYSFVPVEKQNAKN